MKKFLLLMASTCLVVGFAVAEPVVDGKIGTKEYANSVSTLNGRGTLYWSQDAKGGLDLALTVKAKGWIGLGLGSSRMAGAYIYLGLLDSAGKAVFTEQVGKGHRHSDSGKVTADKSAVVSAGGVSTMEFHIAADKLPFTGKNVPFIVAFGNTNDLVPPHGSDDYDSGSFALK